MSRRIVATASVRPSRPECEPKIPVRNIPVDINLVPLLSMTDVVDPEVIVLAPEEWDG